MRSPSGWKVTPERAQATLIGLLVATILLTMTLLAAVSVSTTVVEQQSSAARAVATGELDDHCVESAPDTCVGLTIRQLAVSEQPHRVRLRAGLHLIGISGDARTPVRSLRIDGQPVLSDPAGLDGVYSVMIPTPGRYTITTDGGGGVIRLRPWDG